MQIGELARRVGTTADTVRFYEKSGWGRTGTIVYPSETAQRTIPTEVWRYEKALTD